MGLMAVLAFINTPEARFMRVEGRRLASLFRLQADRIIHP